MKGRLWWVPAGVVLAGAVVAVFAATRPPERCKSPELSALKAEIADADHAFKRGDYVYANETAERAVRTIGDRYHVRNMLDDSGMKLGAALNSGDMKLIASNRTAMARSRFNLFLWNLPCMPVPRTD